MPDTKILIFAYDYEGKFVPEHIIADLEDDLDGLEYGDVAESRYQVWEYPSGKIFAVKSDRVIDRDSSDYYSSPYTSQGTMWLPELVEIRTDKKMVEEAYKRFKK